MLRASTFWDLEKEAPLLILNKGYLQEQGEAVFARTSKWPKLAGLAAQSAPVTLIELDPSASSWHRLFLVDSERTFKSEVNRAHFAKLLQHLTIKFGDNYHQGMSYVASFLSLTLPESDVVALCTLMNNDQKYIPGYWRHEAEKFATDAYVFQELLRKFLPKVAEHLDKNGVDPSTYCQKWFVGLCVHVLPYEYLLRFFEGFLEGGFKFSMKFGLSLVKQLQDKLLAVHNNPAVSLGLLRLDPKTIPHDAVFDEMLKKTFEGTKDFDLDDVDFKALREKAYTTIVKPRLDNARAPVDSDDEIEDCQICKDDFPEVYCKECKLKICETCHNKPPAGSKHLRGHKVKELEASDEEEEEEEEEEDEDDEKEEKANGKKDAAVDKATAGIEKLNV